MMWSTHSRRIDPISRSARPFCQGEAGAVGLSRMPMARNLCFFSSRRRHTIFKCDWSSDVCSSDLTSVRREAQLEAKAAQMRKENELRAEQMSADVALET